MSSDEFLYTGISSASSEPRTPRQEQAESKEQARQKLKPGAQVLLELLEKERVKVTDIKSLVLDRTSTEKEVNTELIARKLYLGYLNSLESKIKTIMKEKKGASDE